MAAESEQPYIFWLYGWSKNPFQMHSDLFKCEISQDLLKVYTDPTLEIPLNLIESCSQVNAGSSYNMRGYVKISQENRDDVYLVPANPIKPSDYVYSVNGESMDLVKVITNFLKNETPSIEKNPYIRTLKRENHWQEIDSRDWDSNTSPWVYFPKDQNKFTVSKFLLSTVAGFLGVMLLLLVILALLGQIHITVR